MYIFIFNFKYNYTAQFTRIYFVIEEVFVLRNVLFRRRVLAYAPFVLYLASHSG